MQHRYQPLEFPAIITMLQQHALSSNAKSQLGDLAPELHQSRATRKMAETTSAKKLLEALGAPPLPLMQGLEEALALAEAGAMLVPDQLHTVTLFATSCKRMASYLDRGERLGEAVATYGRSLEPLSPLEEEISPCLLGDELRDEASPALKSLRRKKEHLASSIKDKLSHILQSRKQYLADGYITTRQGRYVLPVQRKFQSQFGGTVVEASAKGHTVFMEPAAITKLQGELLTLSLEEDAEVRRILYTLSALVADMASPIRRNVEALALLDCLFAKAKLSAAMGGVPATLGGERRLQLRQARHPLLPAEACVPLDFHLEEGITGVIITGPNTGGKTVAMKTVGLLCLMAQCGLHIPCQEGAYIPLQDGYWCDIGDQQSIAQSLSTFSAHMTTVIHILEKASRDSLVLLDELGSGTDPAEGMGIAIAVLEELRRRGCMFLVTTHYPQVKTYAETTPGVQSARMAFNRETLQPLYQLELGQSGESCALHIAARLGLPASLVQRAHQQVYGTPGPESASQASSLPVPKSRLQRDAAEKQGPEPATHFAMGDSVTLLSTGEKAIVYRPADENGDVLLQIKGEKRRVRHTRLKLLVPAGELYPPDYDFSILFDTVENRKARHQLNRKNDPSVQIVHRTELPTE